MPLVVLALNSFINEIIELLDDELLDFILNGTNENRYDD